MISQPYPDLLKKSIRCAFLLLFMLGLGTSGFAGPRFKIEQDANIFVQTPARFTVTALNSDNSTDLISKQKIKMHFTTSEKTETVDATLKNGSVEITHSFETPALYILEVVDASNADITASDLFRVSPKVVKP